MPVPLQNSDDAVLTQELQGSEAITEKSDATGEQQDTPEYVTKKDLEGFADIVTKRIRQSLQDRDKVINSQLSQLKERMQAAGVEMSEAQEAKLRQTIEDEMGDETDEEPAGPASEGDEHPIFAYTANVFKQEGVEITTQDPEFTEVDKALNDPNGSMEKYTSALYSAIAKKRARLEGQKQSADARATSGGGASGKPGFVAKRSNDYWNRAYNKR